ncbi:hypothetical protein EZV62_023684 [Acer yangbiense]|uniref:DUF547 domain-containing protein n=1 Tax=Acer yangbiense TaxID=1000413 RepID=A0A5C7H2H2_9ROSI|nr:hypothetical protein EZV62_023684 [Acer yangbiense]
MRTNRMDGFNVEEGGEAVGKRDNIVHAQQHRRSKSATDRNLDVSRHGVLHSIKKDRNKSHASPLSTRAYKAQNPLYDHPSPSNKSTSSNQRASLEEDVEKLQSCLQQEKSMRTVLEKAMGRVSSTLSPGHRHFTSQTKELIAEIELLEEEVANREQHVLSLYRNIFENCVSRPPSEQSSSVASPAHAKHVSKKHPSIISSAFCSSKKFPLRPLQALVSVNDFGKRTFKTIDAPQFCGKMDVHFKKTCSDPVKAHEKVPNIEKTSMLRTLKDHLCQCPSKLSEEMVRCMAAVYCWLRGSASADPEKNRSPLLSRSSTNVILPRRGIGEDCNWSCKSAVEVSWISTDKNQFSHASFAINNYRVLVEQLERVTVSQMEINTRTAFWINVYNALVMHAYLAYGIPHSSLRRLALFHKSECGNLRKAYETLYKAYTFCILSAKFWSSDVSLCALMKELYINLTKAAYNIGGHIISANAIEQSILCFHTHRMGRWLESILSTALRKKSGDEKQLISSKFGLLKSEPLACFALCTGAFSDPVLKVYTASNVKEELEAAKREFLQANVLVKKSKKVFLPKVLERFAKEASISSDDLLKWVTENVDKKLQESIQKCTDHKSNKKASQMIEWLPYSTRFRYVFSKDLTEKPWCGCEFLSKCLASGGLSMSLAQAIKHC